MDEDQFVTHDEHLSVGAHAVGDVLPRHTRTEPAGQTPQVGFSERVAAADHIHSVVLYDTNGSAPNDGFMSIAGFPDSDIVNGLTCFDSQNHKLWIRTGTNIWKGVVLT